MARANDSLCELETELFATCCLVEVDPGGTPCGPRGPVTPARC